MLTRFLTVARLLRPRALAHNAKAVEDLSAKIAQLHRTLKASAEASERSALQTGRLAEQVAALQTSVKTISLQQAQLSAVYRQDRALAEEVAHLDDLLETESIGAHLRAAVQSSTLHLDPFPHLVIENVWPEPFYDALLKGVPPAELFADRPPNKRRLTVPFDWAPVYGERVWRFLVDRVLNPLFTPVIVEKFRQPLGQWLLRNWPLPPHDPVSAVRFQTTDGRILLRGRGYLIPPHRDPKWSLITCLMYLARPGDSEQWGTQLYSVHDDVEAPSIAAYWIKAERCRLEKNVPFRRNSMLVFLNSDGAHAAQIPSDAPEDVQRYMYQFRVGPTPTSLRELMAMLPEERKGFWSGKVADYN